VRKRRVEGVRTRECAPSPAGVGCGEPDGRPTDWCGASAVPPPAGAAPAKGTAPPLKERKNARAPAAFFPFPRADRPLPLSPSSASTHLAAHAFRRAGRLGRPPAADVDGQGGGGDDVDVGVDAHQQGHSREQRQGGVRLGGGQGLVVAVGRGDDAPGGRGAGGHDRGVRMRGGARRRAKFRGGRLSLSVFVLHDKLGSLFFCFSLSLSHARPPPTAAHTHAHTQPQKRAHTHTLSLTHTPFFQAVGM